MALNLTYQRVAHALDWLVKVYRDPSDNSTVQAFIQVDTEGNAVSVPALNELVINFNSTGENVVIPAVASQVGRVYKIFFVCSAATVLTIKSSAGGTALTGAMSMLANGSFALDLDSKPWFTTISSGDFIISQTGTAQISGRVYYTQS